MHHIEATFVKGVGACVCLSINRPIAPPGYIGDVYPPAVEPIHLKALIDTGANGSAVHAGALGLLSTAPHAKAIVHRPFEDGPGLECPVWEISVNIPTLEMNTLIFERVVVTEASSMQREFGMILGRDFLRNALMKYDGVGQSCIIELADEIQLPPRGRWVNPKVAVMPILTPSR